MQDEMHVPMARQKGGNQAHFSNRTGLRRSEGPFERMGNQRYLFEIPVLNVDEFAFVAAVVADQFRAGGANLVG